MTFADDRIIVIAVPVPPAPHTSVEVAHVPLCDLNEAHGPAYADARLPYFGGSWANVCAACFKEYGASLGLGHGQRLIEREGERDDASD